MVTVEVKTGMPGVFSKVAVGLFFVVVDVDDVDDVSQLFFYLRIIQSSGVLYKTIVCGKPPVKDRIYGLLGQGLRGAKQ